MRVSALQKWPVLAAFNGNLRVHRDIMHGGITELVAVNLAGLSDEQFPGVLPACQSTLGNTTGPATLPLQMNIVRLPKIPVIGADDTDLGIRALVSGFCVIVFVAVCFV